MPNMHLYHFPGACSRVTLTALEQCGCDYDDTLVNLFKGEQHQPQYRAANPRGKIPALIVDGKMLSENAAILLWLHSQYPDAGLFPRSDDWDRAQRVSDLFWLASVVHPAVRANRMPIRMTTGDPAGVKERGKELFAGCMDQFEARMQGREWWLGDDWSIIDTYLYWCYTTAEEGDFDLDAYPSVSGHRQRVSAQPAFQRAIAREATARQNAGLDD